jgi:hypothetical protein
MKRALAATVVLACLLGLTVLALWLVGDAAPPAVPVPTPASAVAVEAAPQRTAFEPAGVREAIEAGPSAAASAPVAAAPDVARQAFRCVDEQGQPVAGARVRLVAMPYGSGVPDLEAGSGDDGLGEFPAVPARQYAIVASAGHRHFVADREHTSRPLPDAPLELLLRELWLAGLEMPGAEVISHGASFEGWMPSDHRMFDGCVAERALVDAWREKVPGAVFWAAVRNPRRPPKDTIEMEVLWFGHELHRQKVRMWPASTFRGPERVEPHVVPAVVWAQPRVVLVDEHDAPLPEPLQVALRETAELGPYVANANRRRPGPDGFPFRDGSAKLPVGEYELRLREARNAGLVAGARCTVAPGQVELRLPVATRDRVVRLHVRGLRDAGYMLRTMHESGRSEVAFARPDGRHTLLLPPGPCTVSVQAGAAERPQVFEHVFVVTEAVEQDVGWDVPAPR